MSIECNLLFRHSFKFFFCVSQVISLVRRSRFSPNRDSFFDVEKWVSNWRARSSRLRLKKWLPNPGGKAAKSSIRVHQTKMNSVVTPIIETSNIFDCLLANGSAQTEKKMRTEAVTASAQDLIGWRIVDFLWLLLVAVVWTIQQRAWTYVIDHCLCAKNLREFFFVP